MSRSDSLDANIGDLGQDHVARKSGCLQLNGSQDDTYRSPGFSTGLYYLTLDSNATVLSIRPRSCILCPCRIANIYGNSATNPHHKLKMSTLRTCTVLFKTALAHTNVTTLAGLDLYYFTSRLA